MTSHSNWPSDFVELKKLEDILQCSICYEYINTCMITPCSHNFCSLCIRKYLQFKTQCPTCFEETHGSDLRKNRLIDEVITIWVKLKDLLLFNVRLATMTQSVKVESKMCNGGDTLPTKSEAKSTKKETKSIKKEAITPKPERSKKSVVQKLFTEKVTSPTEVESKIIVDGVTIPSIFQPQKSPKKNPTKRPEDVSTCPVCNVSIPLKNLNMHLDSCLAASDPPMRLKPKPEKRDPIPKRVYTLMKEKDLKKCLKDYGLSANGDRKAMIARLTRYIVLYNAECDKEEPRAVSEILRQVEREERDEKANPSNPLFQSTRPPTLAPDKKKDPEAIEKANKEYLDLNRDNFMKLIENMKARDGKNIKPLKPLNRIDSDDENDDKPSTSFGVPSSSKISSTSVSEEVVDVSDSDSDIFEESPVNSENPEESPVKSEPGVSEIGLINWNKTLVNDDPEIDTQVMETETVSSNLVDEDNSSSYDSVFNSSIRSEPAKTPKSKLTLSARKRSKVKPSTESPSSMKIGDKFTQIFEEESDITELDSSLSVCEKKVTTKVNGKVEDDKETEDDDSDEEEESDEDEEDSSALGTPNKNDDVSPEISPMKMKSPEVSPMKMKSPEVSPMKMKSPEVSPRKTRSAIKRKSQTSAEKTPTSERKLTGRKRVKQSASPVF